MSLPKITKTIQLFHGKIIDLLIEEFEENSGATSKREIVSHPGGGVVVPLLGNGDLILVRQYRYPHKKFTLEVPAGRLDEGEDPLDGAKRELLEETGYTADKYEKLTAIFTTPGFCNEVLHIYLATGLRKSDFGQKLDEGEYTLRIEYVPLITVIKMIERGEIEDSKTIAGVLLAERRMNR